MLALIPVSIQKRKADPVTSREDKAVDRDDCMWPSLLLPPLQQVLHSQHCGACLHCETDKISMSLINSANSPKVAPVCMESQVLSEIQWKDII